LLEANVLREAHLPEAPLDREPGIPVVLTGGEEGHLVTVALQGLGEAIEKVEAAARVAEGAAGQGSVGIQGGAAVVGGGGV